MLRTAYGPLQLTPAQFWDLTWAEYSYLLDGYLGREIDAWRRTRLIAAETSNLYRKNPIRPEQYMPLPHDHRQTPAQPRTKAEAWEDLKAAVRRFEGTYEWQP